MKKIKLSPFWIAMLVAAGVLVVAFSLIVVPKMNEQKKLQNALRSKALTLQNAREGTPSRADIDTWNRYRGELVRSYNEITKFYSDSDKSFERWFPNMLLGADGDPARDTFMVKFQDEANRLEEKLSGKPYEVKIGMGEEGGGQKLKYGFNWEFVTPSDWLLIGQTDEKGVLHELQKRFWVRQRVANMILSNNVKVNRIADFRFFKPLHDKLISATWAQPPTKPDEAIHWQGVGADTSGGVRGFVETELPNELARTLTFGFALELPYSEVPKALRETLNPSGGQQQEMLVNLVGTHITIREQNEVSVGFIYELGNEADKAAKMADALKKAGGDKPRPVLLAVTCQVIDFEPSKVKKFEVKSAQ